MNPINFIETGAIQMVGHTPIWCDIPDKLEEGHGLLILTPVIYEGLDGSWKANQKSERFKITKENGNYYINSKQIGNINDLNSYLKRVFLRPL